MPSPDLKKGMFDFQGHAENTVRIVQINLSIEVFAFSGDISTASVACPPRETRSSGAGIVVLCHSARSFKEFVNISNYSLMSMI